MSTLSSSVIHDQLDHPVIDIDGHTVEFFPALMPYLREEGVDVFGENERIVVQIGDDKFPEDAVTGEVGEVFGNIDRIGVDDEREGVGPRP